jgi:hypothetical protein
MPGLHRRPPNDSKWLYVIPVFFATVAVVLLVLALRMR